MTLRLVLLGLSMMLVQVLPAGSHPDTSRALDPGTDRVLEIHGTVLEILSRVDATGVASTESPSAARVQLAGDVLFEFNKADLKPQAQAILADVGRDIDTKAKGPVMIDGYTDSVGDATYNQMLSQQRAAAVQRALQPLVNAAGVTLIPSGHGAADPIAPNTNPDGSDNPAGRAQNRRVTVSFAK